MYHIVKRFGQYLGENGVMVDDRASALRVDAATFKALQRNWASDMRLVTVTNRADRAARNVTSTSDPQSAQ